MALSEALPARLRLRQVRRGQLRQRGRQFGEFGVGVFLPAQCRFHPQGRIGDALRRQRGRRALERMRQIQRGLRLAIGDHLAQARRGLRMALAESIQQLPKQRGLAVHARQRGRDIHARQFDHCVLAFAGFDIRRSGIRFRVMRQPARQHAHQFALFDRLGKIIVHADVEEALAVADHRMRGQRDHRHVAQGRVALEPARGLDAVQPRHLDIHQHRAETTLAENAQGIETALGADHVHAHAGQQFLRDHAVDLVVLHQQHFAAGFETQALRRRAAGGGHAAAALASQRFHRPIEQGGRTDGLV